MSNPSNLYAEKVFAEHPLALWALDDTVDYVSLITEEQRDVSEGWNLTNATSAISLVSLNQPFQNSVLNLLECSIPVGPTGESTFISPDLANFQSLNKILGSFCVGAYVYINSPYIKSISIGYEYTDTTSSNTVQDLQKYDITSSGNWVFISKTSDWINENTSFRVVLKIESYSGGITTSDYRYHINGITVGQWSEEFNTKSLGIQTSLLPNTIAIDQQQSLPAAAYGVSENNGYYLSLDNALLAKNTSVPLVFGASGVTVLSPNANGKPSLIVPGKGFLNKLGQYREYTVEFWTKISCNSSTPKRIFGPISSQDGLYVEGGFITLVIGKHFASHFVGEWARPMLINIRVIKNSATLIINGEDVISLPIDTASLSLPSQFDNSGKSQDWIGFYSYQDVSPIEVDCIAIYSYSVPTTVAKRRWVYGQGVVSPEGTNSAFGGTTASVDYSFSNYTANYNYPDFALWQQGSFDNLSTTTRSLSTPDYKLPELFLGSKTSDQFYSDNKAIQSGANKFITFRPNSEWNDVPAYINFPRFNVLNDELHVIYGVFQINEDDDTVQTLMDIQNILTGDKFSIRKHGSHIDYYLTYNGIEEEIYMGEDFPIGEPISVGLDFQELVSYFGGNVAAFFGNQNGLTLYVGGDQTGDMTFTGYIYSIGLSTSFNEAQIENHFSSQGIANIDAANELLAHTASYTLLPTEAYGSFFLDIGVSGYWEDYLPLSYFAKNVQNASGAEYYDLDFLQFNIGYPSPSKFAEKEITQSWTYEDLLNEYSSPVQKTYYQLDNNLYSGWNNYEDMSQHAIKYYEYDTTNASIRSYVTFQYIKDGANKPPSSFAISEPAKQDRIIDVDKYPNWSSTKFEVVDNTLIYPTKSVDFNELAIVSHLDFNIRGIISKPIKLSRLQFASQALNENSFNPVGTRFGVDLYPYKMSGIYYDYKTKNPFSIYKGSTPYLYLTRNSGVQIRGDFDPSVNRGLSMPINQNLAANYRVSAIQMWMRYDEDKFPGTPVELFQIDYDRDKIKFYLVADSETGLRGRIFARLLSTGQIFDSLSYYWNGSLVREPVMTFKEWGVLGVSFTSPIVFDAKLGSIDLNGPVIFNNISYYQANNLQQSQSIVSRPWLKVRSDGVLDFDWEYWYNNYDWQGLLVIGESSIYGVDPGNVYKTYIGTNKIIFDDSDGLKFSSDKIKAYQAVTWSTSVSSAV